MTTPRLLRATCPDCGVTRGETHTQTCLTVECLHTGMPRASCHSEHAPPLDHDCGNATWDGRWPGHDECRDFGWHITWDPATEAWVRCNSDVPGSGPDLGRLREQAIWNSQNRTWRQRRAVLYGRPRSGGRATTEGAAAHLRGWCTRRGLIVVAEYGTAGHAELCWQAVLEDLRAAHADVVAVHAVDALGPTPQQVSARARAVEALGAVIVGPGVRFDRAGLVTGTTAA
ncbi:hypothetical protein Ait01nite_019840 [Actinoplanes italicus]|uniref:Uncharacterized protein n=1 Tax=Actinoplanes italicus TaxID=113567 RepID=A0A2T0KPW0_9ACTN|nr:recombinase family protein [Actinoplanes italicus]PRX25615.1 hypothetical protein CLV67_101332 [Actinoplanes italicus]GIE28939.1 hypothetical protein Ait01nite_019840 [Actinoplanes italicus]